MRIVHVIDYFHTDVGYQEFFLAREQARAGHSVRVVSSVHRHHTVATSGSDEQLGLRQLQSVGVDLVRLPAVQLGHDRAWLRGLRTAITEHRPDIAHVHGPFCPTTVRAVRTCAQLGVPALVDNHIQEAIAPGSTTTAGRLFYAAYRFLFGGALRRNVRAWVANGPYERDFLQDRLRLPPGTVELFPLGFDPSAFGFDPERRARVRRERSWEDDLVVAVTGKLHPGKRVDAVAGALEKVVPASQPHLVLAGSIDPSYLEVVRTASPALTDRGRLEFWPMLPQRELADLYLAADVVVFARLPSISIYEAIGTGARVLVGDDNFARWLQSLDDDIEPVVLDDLAGHLTACADRRGRSDRAAKALGWPSVSASFTERYAALTCGS